MKFFFFALCLSCGLVVSAQTPETFKPYKPTALRLPAVPLVVNDPYFSIWSPFDNLQQGPTKHWTGADKPLMGILRVDGTAYHFMGRDNREILETILPLADEVAWTAPYTNTYPGEGWSTEDFDDSAWPKGQGAFGDRVRRRTHTLWKGDNTDIYIRRKFNLTEEELNNHFLIRYSHDDVCEIFLNGTKIHDTGYSWKGNQKLTLSTEQKKLLHKGTNVLSIHCHNTLGGSYADFGIFKKYINRSSNMLTAVQRKTSVMATSSYYSFQCGPIDLDLVFTAPMIVNDLDLLSSPVNYISYQVRSCDGKPHKVQFYIIATPEMAMDNVYGDIEPVSTSLLLTENGQSYIKSGTLEQPVLKKKGDDVCINWGYFYMSGANGQLGIAPYQKTIQHIIADGKLITTADSIVSEKALQLTGLSYMHDFGAVTQTPKSCFMMIGYDEVRDIEYFNKQYKAYWAHQGKVSIFDCFDKFQDNYQDIMSKCKKQDQVIYDDGMKSGGTKYAEILSGCYRLVIAAHKLFEDDENHLLFFSKENNSNGSVNTVDLTYPSAPLFLAYNPTLQKAMMTSIFEYTRKALWQKPFAAHDIGTYPIANGQTYGGDMPLEESGNMIILTAMLSMLDGNTDYADQYWDILTQWNNYLVENGQDPSNQLCTDDFAGHWAHNCNLAVKAIMGITGYAKMAEMKGLANEAKKYYKIARHMASKWEKSAFEKDHYRLAYDRDSTWSQKYNMIWDKIWQTRVFSSKVMPIEIAYYLKHQNKYGLPLDCRKDYTKSDWIMWTATMADKQEDFDALTDPLYLYINETTSRVPLSDWHDTKTGKYEAFIGRSVIGGYWMKVFADKWLKK